MPSNSDRARAAQKEPKKEVIEAQRPTYREGRDELAAKDQGSAAKNRAFVKAEQERIDATAKAPGGGNRTVAEARAADRAEAASAREPRERPERQEQAAPAPATAPVAPAAPTGPNAATYGAGYDADTAAAMQGGPAATMARANEAAREQAKMQADLATRNAIQAGRSAGMMPGQAALGAQTQAANAYGVGMGQGQQQFAGYTQLGGQLGAEMAQRGLTEKSIDVQKYSAEQQAKAAQRQANQGLLSSLFGAFGGIASLFSDRRLKEDTVPARIASSLDKINSYTYKYKGNSRPEAGVMAQDLEKTAMAPAVIDTPQGKAVDTNRLSTMNTAALSEHEKRLKDIERMIRDMGGINA